MAKTTKISNKCILHCPNNINLFQRDDGSFREDYIYDGMYQRKIPIEFQEIALTAHAVIALSSFMHQVNSITDRRDTRSKS